MRRARAYSQGARSQPPPTPPSRERLAADTLDWIVRVEGMISAKQVEYTKRMDDLQAELDLPEVDRCGPRICWSRSRAKTAVDDMRELLWMLRDTIDRMPSQLLQAAPADGMASMPGIGEVATRVVDELLDIPAASLSCGDEDCPICLSALTGGEDSVVALPCGAGHRFHRQCMRDWARLSERCPLCRAVFASSANGQPQQPQPAAPGPSASPAAVVEVVQSPPRSSATPAAPSAARAFSVRPRRMQPQSRSIALAGREVAASPPRSRTEELTFGYPSAACAHPSR